MQQHFLSLEELQISILYRGFLSKIVWLLILSASAFAGEPTIESTESSPRRRSLRIFPKIKQTPTISKEEKTEKVAKPIIIRLKRTAPPPENSEIPKETIAKEKKDKIARYLAKRSKRIWDRKIKYDVRKKFAETRYRIKGTFLAEEQLKEVNALKDALAKSDKTFKMPLSFSRVANLDEEIIKRLNDSELSLQENGFSEEIMNGVEDVRVYLLTVNNNAGFAVINGKKEDQWVSYFLFVPDKEKKLSVTEQFEKIKDELALH